MPNPTARRRRRKPGSTQKSDVKSVKLTAPVILLGCILIAVLLESRVYFVERLGGMYLNWRNRDREAYGAFWERQQHSRQAAQQLRAEAGEASRLRNEAQKASSFNELVGLVPDGEGLPISPDKFVELYLTLPTFLQRQLIDPTELTGLRTEGAWHRSAVWKYGDGGSVYLIDRNHQVLRNLSLSPAFLQIAAFFGKTAPGRLDDVLEFSGHIYPAQRFFDLFYALPDSIRQLFFPETDIMLRLPTSAARVGLSAPEGEEYGLIGFETDVLEGNQVVLFAASSRLMQKLIWRLSWEGSDTLFFNPDDVSPQSTDREERLF